MDADDGGERGTTLCDAGLPAAAEIRAAHGEPRANAKQAI